MEQQVIFRDYQEQQAEDHNNLQDFMRESLDHVVNDAVTASRRYAGFNTQKTAQVEIQIAPGRFYDVAGAVFARNTTTVQSMVTYLPAVAQRIIALTVYGTETEVEVEERDFLVDVDTGRTEPEAVPTVRSRDAVLAFVAGTESADPQPPAIPVTSVVIAYIRLDPTQIVSVTMETDNQVTSTENLGTRTNALEAFDSQIGPRVTALASDLAALSEKLKNGGQQIDIVRLYTDLAELREKAKLPDTYAAYGADYFINPLKSDTTNSQSLGYDAMVDNGLRFAPANADLFEISLFSPNDPNASYASGLLLPKYTDELKLTTGAFHSDQGIAQYGFQTYNLIQGKIKKDRLRYGGQYTRCTNGVALWTQQGEQPPFWLPDFETYQTVAVTDNGNPGHLVQYFDYWWHDSWTEPYWKLEVNNITINGAQVAQSFLVANDTWCTKVGFYITQKAADENILISLCEVVNGQPDLTRVISHQSYPHASIVVGWNRMSIVPTFLARGGRYALVFTSNANHKIGMTFGQSFLDGTFFTATDGAYFLGDLMKDMMIEIWGAKFNAPQVTIEFAAINLDGGIRAIDITAGMIVPASCQLVWEVRPNGVGDWIPLTLENVNALTSAPPLMQFRGRFVGTRDIQAGVMLTGSRVYVWRPKTAFTHVSTPVTIPSSTAVHVRLLLESFDDTPHDVTCVLRRAGVDETPDATVTTTINVADKQYQRDFTFNMAATTAFTIKIIGATNSPANIFHVAERIHYSL